MPITLLFSEDSRVRPVLILRSYFIGISPRRVLSLALLLLFERVARAARVSVK
jgi:hypothetical protein